MNLPLRVGSKEIESVEKEKSMKYTTKRKLIKSRNCTASTGFTDDLPDGKDLKLALRIRICKLLVSRTTICKYIV